MNLVLQYQKECCEDKQKEKKKEKRKKGKRKSRKKYIGLKTKK